MKIGITFLAFGKDIFAGMENALYSFAKGLQLSGHDVSIFTSEASGTETNIDEIPIFRSQNLPREYSNGDRAIIASLLANKQKLQSEMKKFLDLYKPDILIAWDPLWGFIQYLNVQEFSTIPTYLSLHVISDSDVLDMSEEYPYRKRFGVSDIFIKQLYSAGYKKHIDILPNSIDIKKVLKQSKSARQFGTREYIFCNARLSPEKGVKYAVEGFAIFNKSYPNYDLYLCDGDFPFGDKNIVKNEINELSQTLGISDRIIYIPKLSWAEVPGIISASFCTVLPSLIESFGLAVLESLAIGKPTITTTAGNLPFLVQDAGILVDPENSDQIAAALKQLVDDNDLYNLLSTRASSRAANFDSLVVAKEFIEEISKDL